MGLTIVLQNQEQQLLSRGEIIRLLDEQIVIWRDWGTRHGTRTFEKFCEYHWEDQFYISNGSEIGITLDVNVAVVRPYHKLRGHWMELFEHHQIGPDGHYLERKDFDGVGETMHRGATIRAEAERALRDELGWDDPDKYQLSKCHTLQIRDPVDSEKWPGSNVKSVYHRHIHDCLVGKDLFDLGEKVEIESDGRKIFFRWRRSKGPTVFF